MMAAKLIVALAVALLVAFLAGPAASQSQQQQGPFKCFNGWAMLPTQDPRLCRPSPDVQTRSAVPPPSGEGLSYGYYNRRCPSAERIVRDAVRKAVAANPGIGAGLIRLFFHDCFVRGCDASVLLTQTAIGNSDVEREGLPNKDSLRGFEVIDEAKAAIEAACPNVVSCADVVAYAARDASSSLSGGRISFRMLGGRLDGRESFANETDQLPGPFSNITELQKSFRNKGLSSDEMVTLSGAHSIGRGRCSFASGRFADMDPTYAAKLRAQCNGDGRTFLNQDDVTPYVLDRQYYRNVIDRRVLFTSDAELINSTQTTPQVNENANTAGAWERKFAQAMETMGKIGVKTRTRPGQGTEIRKVCSRVN